MKLIIVESPTKAKTLSRFLGGDFVVKSSYGHIRDLPKSEMGVDIEHDFAPKYVLPPKARKVATELKKDAKVADMVYFATDEDREGEAISWHLAEILKPAPKKAKRIVFHEITKEAILEALKNPRDLDIKLVDAQQARRVLDRLVGYELSPLLWRKVAKGLSAGRVQSVAVRLIVEREREISAFKAQEYWTIEALFQTLTDTNKKRTDTDKFLAKLHKIGDKVLEKFDIPNETEAKKIAAALDGTSYAVAGVQRKEVRRNPLPPFTTSTLQQEANRRLGFSAKQTMMLAQQLYEGVELGEEGAEGLITYMRTDSVNLAEKFLGEAQKLIHSQFGAPYTRGPRTYTTKSKLAQEAHEAIRPTEVKHTPQNIKKHLNSNQFRLYDLIWRRAVASQMSEALIDSTTVDIAAAPYSLSGGRKAAVEGPSTSSGNKSVYTFRATGSIIKFDGFLKAWPTSAKEELLPPLKENDALTCEKLEPIQHFTEPPPRYSDASLVKALEEHGIGRPSTYAPTISTIIERGYVERIEARRLKPTDVGVVVTDLLIKHFPKIVDYKFTARLEDELDEIAEGKVQWVPVIREFYGPFKENLTEKYEEIKKKDIVSKPTDQICDKCGKPIVERLGRFGKFLGCSGFPGCRNIKKLENGSEAKPKSDYKPVPCPKCKPGELVEKRTRKRGKLFYACNRYPDCDFALWSRPTGEMCPKCGELLVLKKKDLMGCSSKECDYSRETAPVPKPEQN